MAGRNSSALVVAGGLGGGFPCPAYDLGDDGVVLDEAAQLLLGEADSSLRVRAQSTACACRRPRTAR